MWEFPLKFSDVPSSGVGVGDGGTKAWPILPGEPWGAGGGVRGAKVHSFQSLWAPRLPFPSKLKKEMKDVKVSRRKPETCLLVFQILLYPCLILKGTPGPRRWKGSCFKLYMCPKVLSLGCNLTPGPRLWENPRERRVLNYMGMEEDVYSSVLSRTTESEI